MEVCVVSTCRKFTYGGIGAALGNVIALTVGIGPGGIAAMITAAVGPAVAAAVGPAIANALVPVTQRLDTICQQQPLGRLNNE
jgi:outer membrane lipoprotein SlyB